MRVAAALVLLDVAAPAAAQVTCLDVTGREVTAQSSR